MEETKTPYVPKNKRHQTMISKSFDYQTRVGFDPELIPTTTYTNLNCLYNLTKFSLSRRSTRDILYKIQKEISHMITKNTIVTGIGVVMKKHAITVTFDLTDRWRGQITYFIEWALGGWILTLKAFMKSKSNILMQADYAVELPYNLTWEIIQ